jgi:hypothetical protein
VRCSDFSFKIVLGYGLQTNSSIARNDYLPRGLECWFLIFALAEIGTQRDLSFLSALVLYREMTLMRANLASSVQSNQKFCKSRALSRLYWFCKNAFHSHLWQLCAVRRSWFISERVHHNQSLSAWVNLADQWINFCRLGEVQFEKFPNGRNTFSITHRPFWCIVFLTNNKNWD